MGRRDPLPRDALVGVNVLVVDDDPDARQVIRTVLQYCGALVTTAASAQQALRLLSRILPDVIVVDIVMPARDGYWLLEQIRALPPDRGGSVPALACTAYHDEHTPERLAAAGFQKLLRKPIDPWELSRCIASLARSST
jgi:CheY-like chemotaxis protein